MKLLVVNKQNPNETHYHSVETIGTWLWGRRISNYIFIAVDEHFHKIIEIYTTEVDKIQAKFDKEFGRKV